MKFIKTSYTIIGIIASGIVILSGYTQNAIRIAPFFASYDPYYHYAITNQILNNKENSRYITNAIVKTKTIYTSLLYQQTINVSLITGISVKNIFHYGGGILLLATFLMLFCLGKKLSGSDGVGIIAGWLRVGSNYILIRSSMYLPENFALFFIILILYFLYVKKHTLSLLTLFIYGYFHYRSWYVPIGIIGSYYIIDAFANYHNKKTIKIYSLFKRLLPLVVIVIGAYPINIEYAQSLRYIVSGYLGLIPQRSDIAPNKDLYVVPNLIDFSKQVGNLQSSIGIIAFITLVFITFLQYVNYYSVAEFKGQLTHLK